MSKETWAQIIDSKSFNVQMYRRGLTILMGSLLLNLIMGIVLFYLCLHVPERDYYATSGIIPPIQLDAMAEANRSSNALLPDDPPVVNERKEIPQ